MSFNKTTQMRQIVQMRPEYDDAKEIGRKPKSSLVVNAGKTVVTTVRPVENANDKLPSRLRLKIKTVKKKNRKFFP